MNTYYIERVVSAVATIDTPSLVFGAYTFRQLRTTDGGYRPAWGVSGRTQSNGAVGALMEFDIALIPYVNALSIVTQCAATFRGQTYWIHRQTNNPDNVIVVSAIKGRRPTGMPITGASKPDIERLVNAQNNVALNFLREAINATSILGRITMLVMACEALAGTTYKTRNCPNQGCGFTAKIKSTDQAELKNIAGESLFQIIWKGTKQKGALRHKLMHGGYVSDDEALNIAGPLYEMVWHYVSIRFGLTTVMKILHAPRTFDAFAHLTLFAIADDPSRVTLEDIQDNWPSVPGVKVDQSRYSPTY